MKLNKQLIKEFEDFDEKEVSYLQWLHVELDIALDCPDLYEQPRFYSERIQSLRAEIKKVK